MKNLKAALIIVGFLALGANAMASENGQAKFESKQNVFQAKKEISLSKEDRSPAAKVIKKLKKRQEVLRSNGQLERIYSFSVSL